MRKTLHRAAATILAAALFMTIAHAKPSVSANSWILMDADTGVVLESKNEARRSLIASTTKIMTALVVLENCDLEEQVRIPDGAIGIEGSSVYLKSGEQLTVRELLYCMMLHSGNDAAVALALFCGGTQEQFVSMMNQKASDLGLVNTHFENPNGLDGEEHYSTAFDLAQLTRYALKSSEFTQIVGTKEIRVGTRALRNHNRLLWMTDGIIGVKTGYTRAAGRILVSAAKREQRTLIAVTIFDGNDWVDHCALYDYGFSLYENRILIEAGQKINSFMKEKSDWNDIFSDRSVEFSAAPWDHCRIEIIYPKLPVFQKGRILADVYIGDLWIDRLELKWGSIG